MARTLKDDCCVRESTLIEEIEGNVADEFTQKRMIRKAEMLIQENHKQGEYLFNCHREIDQLNIAIVEQAKMIANLSGQIRNLGITPCEY